MQRYGIIDNGNLIIGDLQLEGYKPVVYEDVPEFDQLTQYVCQGAIIDNGDTITVGVEIRTVEITEEDGNEFI